MHAGGDSRRFAAIALALAAILLAPGAAPALATTPEPLNAVTATGASRNPPTGLGAVVDLAIDARSSPLGEDPTGTVDFAVMINRITHLEPFPLSFSGPVTCLNVVGNVAILNFDYGFPVTVKLVDAGGNGNDGFDFASGNTATDCSSFPTGAFEFAFDQTLGAGRVVVDDAPPDTALTHTPPAVSARQRVRFAFSSSEPGSFECSLDGAAYSSCVSPRRYRHVDRGHHTFRARAVDAGGNADPSPAAYEFRTRRRSDA